MSEKSRQAAFSPVTIANFFIGKAADTGGLGRLKTQKLIYCAYGWWLVLVGETPPLVNERPEAWRMGPVFPTLYHRLKSHGVGTVSKLVEDYDEASVTRLDENDNIKHFLHSAWLRYEPYSGLALSHITHREGSPWQRVISEHGKNTPSLKIPNAYIKEEFERIRGAKNVGR